VTIVVRDDGPGFDPAEVPDPTVPEMLERASGRGMLLMRTFMDEVRYNKAGNEVTMIKRRDDRGPRRPPGPAQGEPPQAERARPPGPIMRVNEPRPRTPAGPALPVASSEAPASPSDPPSRGADPAAPASADADDPLSPGSGPPPGATPGIVLDLSFQAPPPSPSTAAWLDREIRRALRAAGVDRAELGVTVVGDTDMAELHRRHKDTPGTTDVLTFDLRDDPADPIDADVVLCLDEAARQAAERGHGVELELLLYAVHALMHLLGEDDQDAASAGRMHRREDALLEALGHGRVFGRGPEAADAGDGPRGPDHPGGPGGAAGRR